MGEYIFGMGEYFLLGETWRRRAIHPKNILFEGFWKFKIVEVRAFLTLNPGHLPQNFTQTLNPRPETLNPKP
jgi:hypothetical protein